MVSTEWHYGEDVGVCTGGNWTACGKFKSVNRTDHRVTPNLSKVTCDDCLVVVINRCASILVRGKAE